MERIVWHEFRNILNHNMDNKTLNTMKEIKDIDIPVKTLGAIAEGTFARFGMERTINREIFGRMIKGLWLARRKNGVKENLLDFLQETIAGCRDYEFFDHAIMALYQQMYFNALGLA